MKPSDIEVTTYINRCPECKRSGRAAWYLPINAKDRERLQLVIHHGLGKGGWRRNDKHVFNIFRKAKPGEIKISYRAKPMFAPDLQVCFSK